VGEIFRELQEESKERETRAAFERWMAERGTPLPLEQTQAYEAFKAGMGHQHCMTVVQIFRTDGAALAQPEAHPPRDEWRPASEPPEDARQVLGRQKRGHCESVHFLNGSWFVEATGRHTLTITHWRDVTPPTEGAK